MAGKTIAEALQSWSDAHLAFIEAVVAANRIVHAAQLGTPARAAARKERERLVRALAKHEAEGIKAVDAIAAASSSAQLTAAAADAKSEAMKLSQATQSINQVAGFINLLTGLANQLVPLPGLFAKLAL